MINFKRVRTIINKEWAEMFKNRLVLFTIVLLPLVFTALPLVILFVIGSSTGTAGVPAQFALGCGNLPAQDCMQIYI
jgi:ABC-type Na+ efflux pump permease subunit